VFIPARWTDLPLAHDGEAEPVLELVATPDGWRRFGELLSGVRTSSGQRASVQRKRR
jgi:hypothetical protein